jgi:hypothetical protein
MPGRPGQEAADEGVTIPFPAEDGMEISRRTGR